MQIEELNVVKAGKNYGWPDYEGTFVFPITSTEQKNVYHRKNASALAKDPSVMLDHDDMYAIASGFPYDGDTLPHLSGKYLFGDIVDGSLYAISQNWFKENPFSPAPIENITKVSLEQNGISLSVSSLVNNERADLRIAKDAMGDLYLMSKTDGSIWRVASTIGL
ncbi:PQQ-dependent sugar dehydrogenase [Ningiella sp. W23]|uniref:PQQ-dependent sugar dehydrogenase n=1 Tax=Ningiella sp. W23 TaxID=3023715 RepID=UPI00375764AA